MTKDEAKAFHWLESHGYKVIYNMGSTPSENHYIAIPRGPHKHILRGTLERMVEKVQYQNNH